MLTAFTIIFPVFALMGLGWIAAKTQYLDKTVNKGISDFVFYIAIPALLFRSMATAKLPEANPLLYWISYFGPVAVIWFIASTIGRKYFGYSSREGAITGFTTAQANIVMLGIPLIFRVVGDEGAVPLFLLVAINLPIMVSVATIIIENKKDSGSFKTVAVNLAKNPLLLGIAAGVLFRATDLTLPDPIFATLKYLGDAASPCALFATGMALNYYGMSKDRPLIYIICILKLLIHPLLVWCLTKYAFGLPPMWCLVGTLIAMCPSGINAYLMADRYKTSVEIASGAIALSTVLAVFTMTLGLAILR